MRTQAVILNILFMALANGLNFNIFRFIFRQKKGNVVTTNRQVSYCKRMHHLVSAIHIICWNNLMCLVATKEEFW